MSYKYNYTEENIRFSEEDMVPAKKAKEILLYLFCSLGVPANVLSLLVLPRLRMKSPMKFCLQFLAMFDGLYLILRFLSIPISNKLWLKIPRHVAMTTAIWTTVLISVKLFIAVWLPFKDKSLCTYRRTVFCNFLCLLIGICLCVPRFFLFPERNLDTNMYLSNYLYLNSRYGSQLRTLKEEYYLSEEEFHTAMCYGWIQVSMLYFVPALLVTFFNVCVYIEIWKLKRHRRKSDCSKQREINLTKIVFVIVIVFLISGAPWVVKMIANLSGTMTPTTYEIMWLLFAPLPAVNSAANFVIYFVLNKDFQNTLLKMLRCSRNRTKTSQTTRDTSSNTTQSERRTKITGV